MIIRLWLFSQVLYYFDKRKISKKTLIRNGVKETYNHQGVSREIGLDIACKLYRLEYSFLKVICKCFITGCDSFPI